MSPNPASGKSKDPGNSVHAALLFRAAASSGTVPRTLRGAPWGGRQGATPLSLSGPEHQSAATGSSLSFTLSHLQKRLLCFCHDLRAILFSFSDNFHPEFEFRGEAKSDTSPWINTSAWYPHDLIMTTVHHFRLLTEPGSQKRPYLLSVSPRDNLM